MCCQNTAYPRAFTELKAEGLIPKSCELRSVKYLNNFAEQDHRFIKRLAKPGMGFFSWQTAWKTVQEYKVMNMIRKGRMKGVSKGDILGQMALVSSLFGVAV
ncbi:MAG: DDE-type integrase/transposase/recombinase [Ktedonobacteraceae bacterium]